MWDEVGADDGDRRLIELKQHWWAKMLKSGANSCPLRQKIEPSVEAVKDITSAVIKSTSPVPLSTPHVPIESGPVQRSDIVILCVSFLCVDKTNKI